MKIILSAFNKMWSEEMDIPENSGNSWYLILPNKIEYFISDNQLSIPPVTFDTRCKFEWTGKYNTNSAKIYKLVDIIKL
jgi:hypothetical protein